MNRILLFFLLLMSALPGYGQAFQVESLVGERIHVTNVSNVQTDIEVPVRVTNLTDDTLSLKWSKTVYEQPESWVTQINDDETFYLPNVNSNIDPAAGVNAPLVLAAGESAELVLHVFPLGVQGTGIYNLMFAYSSLPGYVVESLDLEVNASPVVKSTETRSLSIYPNPAISYIEITPNNQVDRIEIYNTVGREVRSFFFENGKRYNIADLPQGLYMVALVSEKSGIIKTVRLLKRTIRP